MPPWLTETSHEPRMKTTVWPKSILSILSTKLWSNWDRSPDSQELYLISHWSLKWSSSSLLTLSIALRYSSLVAKLSSLAESSRESNDPRESVELTETSSSSVISCCTSCPAQWGGLLNNDITIAQHSTMPNAHQCLPNSWGLEEDNDQRRCNNYKVDFANLFYRGSNWLLLQKLPAGADEGRRLLRNVMAAIKIWIHTKTMVVWSAKLVGEILCSLSVQSPIPCS